MTREIRGLEDRDIQERKPFLRDVRPLSQRIADVLKSGELQIGGIFGAGVFLFFFPVYAAPLFCLGMMLFGIRCACVRNERLPFRMPPGLEGTDKGDSARKTRLCQA